MYYFWPTVFLALVVFIIRLPGTVRRVKVQREALRPVQPVTRSDHLPCILNTIGVIFTEFFMLGLTTLVVFLLSNVALKALWQAPDLSTGIRHISLGALTLISATAATIALLLAGGTLAWGGLTFGSVFVVVAWMVLSTAGDQGLTIILFALASVAAPALLILLLRRLF